MKPIFGATLFLITLGTVARAETPASVPNPS